MGEAVRFDTVNTAAYSPRPNTLAATFHDQVSEEVKKERLQRINDLARRHSLERAQALVGKTVEVLVEGRNARRADQWRGRTRSGRICYVSEVGSRGDGRQLAGRLMDVRVTQAFAFS